MKLPEALQEIAEPEEELSETPLWPTTVSELPTAKYNAFVDSLVPDEDSRGLETSIHRRWWMDVRFWCKHFFLYANASAPSVGTISGT